MDRTTARRLYNEITAEVDINRPDGILRSSDVDAYIGKALKPLIEEGKAFRRISVNRRTGIRSTSYAYQGGKKIQDSINAILAEMPAAMGYEIDPATGNVSGTHRPPPMTVTNQGQHYYNETKERILDPRAAAAIKADALRAGGVSTTDKASGYTTTLVRAGLSGETRRMRKLVDDTDVKYLAGELPSAALADGASPATVAERARAQVSRQANLKDAKRAAFEAYIQAHPGSTLAIEEALKTQKITSREEKARLLAAERTPGTPEFQARVHRILDRSEARKKAVDAYAKANPKSGIAKKQASMKRRLAMTKSLGWLAVIVGAVAGVADIGKKIFSSLLEVGRNVHKISTEGARFNMAAPEVAQLSARADVMRMDKEIFSKVLGGMDASLAGPRSGEALNRFIDAIAPMSSQTRGKTIDESIQLFLNKAANPLELMQTGLDEAFSLALQGKNELGQLVEGGPLKAFSVLAKTLNSAQAGWGDILLELGRKYYEGNNTGLQKAVTDRVSDGEHWLDAIAGVMHQADKAETAAGLASPNERDAAEQAGEKWNTLVTSMGNLWDSIKIKVLAATEALHSAAEGLLRWVISIPGVRKAFPAINEVARAFDETNYETNKVENERNDYLITAYTKIADATTKEYGTTTEDVRQSMEAFKETPLRRVLPEGFRTDEGFKKWFALTGVLLGLEEAEKKKVMFTEQALNYEDSEPVLPVPDVSLQQRQIYVEAAQHKLFGEYMDTLNELTEKMRPEDYAGEEAVLRKILTDSTMRRSDLLGKSEEERLGFVLNNPDRAAAWAAASGVPDLKRIINTYLLLQEAKMLDENMQGDNKGELYVHRHVKQSGNTFGMASLVGLEAVKAGLADLLASVVTSYDIRAGEKGTELTINIDATDGRSFHYTGKNLQNGTHNVRAQGSGSVLLNTDAWQNGFKPTPP
jgi:hypothetical protein